MSLHLRHQIDVRVRQGLVTSRRHFLRGIVGAGAAAASLSWTDLMTLRAADLRKQGRACILLWMQGGPSQFETFSPKPEHRNGGGTKAIATSAPDIQIADNLPRLSSVMNDVAVIRSMTSKEHWLLAYGEFEISGLRQRGRSAN